MQDVNKVAKSEGGGGENSVLSAPLSVEWAQNKSPRDVPLPHVDYFVLEAHKTQQTQEKHFISP